MNHADQTNLNDNQHAVSVQHLHQDNAVMDVTTRDKDGRKRLQNQKQLSHVVTGRTHSLKSKERRRSYRESDVSGQVSSQPLFKDTNQQSAHTWKIIGDSSGVNNHSHSADRWRETNEPNEEGSPSKHSNQSVHHSNTGDLQEVDHHAADSSPEHSSDFYQHHQRLNSYNDANGLHVTLDEEFTNHSLMKGASSSHAYGGEVSRGIDKQEYAEESDVQAHTSFSQRKKDSNAKNGGALKQGVISKRQKTQHHQQLQQQQQNKSGPPRATRKAATFVKQNPDRTGVRVRKRSATYPPGAARQSRIALAKAGNGKRAQVLSDSHIPVPIQATKGATSPDLRGNKFSKPQPDQTNDTTNTDGMDHDFSRQVPLPPIGSGSGKGHDIISVEKNPITTGAPVAKFKSRDKRPSTKQSEYVIIEYRQYDSEWVQRGGPGGEPESKES